MKFAFIQEHLTEFPVAVDVSCEVLAVSRSGYYAWLRRSASARAERREDLAMKIEAVHEQNRRVYGSPRVCQALRAQGESVCENTVADIMNERQIRAKHKRTMISNVILRHSDEVDARPDFALEAVEIWQQESLR